MKRAVALDALRGIALLGMALSGMIPFGEVNGRHLPSWMFHAQAPPPGHKLDPSTFGITWVDLVFPFFLFAMGAAIPLAFERRREEGVATWRLVVATLMRFVSLGLFAFVVKWTTVVPADGPPGWWRGMLAFVLMAMAWGRLPNSVPKWGSAAMNIVGVLGLIWFLGTWTFAALSAVNWDAPDVILLVLANVALGGGLAYLLLGRSTFGLVFLTGLVMILFVASQDGMPPVLSFLRPATEWTPAPDFYLFELMKYLAIVVPGILAGRLYLQKKSAPIDWLYSRGLIFVSLVIVAGTTSALFARSFVVLWAISAVAAVMPLLLPPSRERSLALWGTLFLILGVLAESVGGGIRKDPATLAYFPVTAGLAFWLLAGLEGLEGMGQRGIAAVGMNPMLGYIAITTFVPAFTRILPLNTWFGTWAYDDLPTYGLEVLTVYGVLQMLLVALVCVVGTKLRFFLRT
ncbi:MAG: DUF5009 domain-containing protein [Fimbriimonadaceae bacterium]|nr:DUF5009 domain-containing protein [Fimbriimonadaceae bacterium]